MIIQCPNKKCRKKWDYAGLKKEGFYTSCPDCKHSVKIRRLNEK